MLFALLPPPVMLGFGGAAAMGTTVAVTGFVGCVVVAVVDVVAPGEYPFAEGEDSESAVD